MTNTCPDPDKQSYLPNRFLSGMLTLKNMDSYQASPTQNFSAVFESDNYLYFNRDHFLTSSHTDLELRFLHDHLKLHQSYSHLDLACGHGRHTNPLAATCRKVVGIDANFEFLQMASKMAISNGLSNVEYILKDIRQIRYKNKFDRITLLNTVFGLFEESENTDLLCRIGNALKPNGKFCFDIINRDTILVNFQSDSIIAKEGNYLLDRLSFDERTGRVHNQRVYMRNGVTTHAPFSLRVYNFTEIEGLLRVAKLRVSEVFADWQGNLFNNYSKKLVVIAEKIGNREQK